MQRLTSLITSDRNQPISIAKKPNESQVIELVRKTRKELNSIVTSNLGEQERWIPAGAANVSCRTLENLFATEGQIGTMGKRNMITTLTEQRAHKKIEKSVHNNDVKKTKFMQTKSDTIMPIKKVQEEQGGKGIGNLQYAILANNQEQLSIIHHSKSIADDLRPHELRQKIRQRKTVSKVRYVHSLPNTAGALTKTIKTGAKLLQLVQKSQHNLPTGTFVKESTMSSIRTWNELMRIDQQKERSQDEVDERDTDGQMVALGNKREGEGDNTNKRVLFTSVQFQSPPEQEDKEQRRRQESRWTCSSRYLPSYLLL